MGRVGAGRHRELALTVHLPFTQRRYPRADAIVSLEEALKLNPGAKATEKKLQETKEQLAEEEAMSSVEAFGSGV